MSDDDEMTADDIEVARALIEQTDGNLPNTVVVPFMYVQHCNPELAASLVEAHGPLDPMTPILIIDGEASLLEEED